MQVLPGTSDVPRGRDAAVPELGRWHRALLRLAGRLPDALISQARQFLAADRHLDVATALAFAAATMRVPMPEADAHLIRTELTGNGIDSSVMDGLEISGTDEDELRPVIPWVFAPQKTTDDVDQPLLTDLTATSSAALAQLDDADRSAIAVAEQKPEVSALFRAWRYAGLGSAWPLPRRVFTVMMAPEAAEEDLPAVTADFQDALIEAGNPDPQVEVCPADFAGTAYHMGARSSSALLWAAEPVGAIRIARVFDGVDPQTGPWFEKSHPKISDDGEREQLLEVLGTAPPVLATVAVMNDVLRPDLLPSVPLTFRTDGHWIWTDAVTYYLHKYSLAPEPELREHARLSKPHPQVSVVAMHRVLAFLQQPDRHQGVWVVPSMASASLASGPIAGPADHRAPIQETQSPLETTAVGPTRLMRVPPADPLTAPERVPDAEPDAQLPTGTPAQATA